MPESREIILERFRALGMKVTDDFDKVQARIQQMETGKSRERQDADYVKATKAEEWFTTVQPLRNRQKLQESVETLQGFFWDIAHPGATRDLLIRLAKEQFDFDDDLAEKTIRNRARHPGEPEKVVNLQAQARPSCVRLSWRRPTDRCEGVIVHRQEIGSRGQPKTIVDNQLRDDCRDNQVDPGKHYKYTVYSVFQGRTNMDAPEIEVAIPLEVPAKASFVVREGEPAVEVFWKPPENCTGMVVCRRIGAEPKINEDLSPADAETLVIELDRQASGWTDDDVVEGKTHCYLIVARFDNGRSDGDLKSVPVARRPSAVPSASAVYASRTNSVKIEWQAPGDGGRMKYDVVRRDGTAAAGAFSEGLSVITDSQATKGTDTDVEPGKVYTYAVFANSQGLRSRQGTPTDPVVILAEVKDLHADPRDREVEFRWKTPANVHDILILRAADPDIPGGPQDSKAEKVSHSREAAQDTGLSNDVKYNYLFCCKYLLPDGRSAYSEGVLQKGVVPREAPPPVRQLVVEETEGMVCTRHESVDGAKVAIFRCPRPPRARVGDVVKLSDVESWGERIESEGVTQALDRSPRADTRYYLPVSIRGSLVTVGQVRKRAIPDIEDLTAYVVEVGVRLQWSWPDDCEHVRIVRRIGAWPQGPQDPAAAKIEFTREDYMRMGESALDRLPPKVNEVQDVYYIGYSRIGGELAIADTEGCRCRVQVKRAAELQMEWKQTGKQVLVRWRFDSEPSDFGGFVLVGNSERPPMDETDGHELVRWPVAGSNGTITSWHEHKVALGGPTSSLHLRLILLNKDDNTSIRIMYPSEAVFRPRKRPRKQVVCPHCFETFGVWEMRFRYGKDDPDKDIHPLPGALWARISPFYQMQLNMPKGPGGRTFTDKLCPSCCKQPGIRALPYSAGASRSVMIGLLGSSHAGKTCYVVSLIQRLRDMGYQLRDIDQDTINRFERMQKMLFVDKQALPPTQRNLDPALIYSLDGKEQTCTLALHDTSGENLGTGEDILEKTPYLREADGLIYLVDPLQCASLAKALGGSPGSRSAKRVMDALVKAYDLWAVKKDGRKFSMPMAVVLTKADILQDAGFIPDQLLWNRPVFHEGRYNVHLHQDTDRAFEQLVQRSDSELFSGITQHFGEYAFFGVSATGSSADSEAKFERVVPHRVEDPLLWLLYRLGIIEGQ